MIDPLSPTDRRLLFRVEADALHLRSAPDPRPATRRAILPHGHLVEGIGDTEPRPGWRRVATTLDDRELEGFVASRFLGRVEVRAALATSDRPPPLADGRDHRPPEAHLSRGRTDVTRRRAGGRAHPIGEHGAPRREHRGAPDPRAIDRIVDWLAVEASPRYLPAGGATFCNIYACDVCHLAGAYLPRVWWTETTLAAWAAGRPVEARYGATVRELTANDLFDWLREWGPRFGWRRTFDAAEARAAATRGSVGVACARRRDRARPGHITVLVPDPSPPRPASPLWQSQAGTVNHRRFRSRWWGHPRFLDHGFFIHDP